MLLPCPNRSHANRDSVPGKKCKSVLKGTQGQRRCKPTLRILPELRLAEICADRIKPRDFEGSAPNQRRLAIIFRSGGVVHFGNIFFAVRASADTSLHPSS